MSWPKAALGDLVEVRGGGTPSKANPDFWTGSIPWVSPKDMKHWEIRSSEDSITEEAIRSSATNLVPENSVLVVNRSGILKNTLPVGISRRAVAINQDLKALICGSRADPNYIARMVKAAEPIVLKWVRATTADNFSIENLKLLQIPFPPLDEQRRIAAILDKADALRRKRKRALDLLDSLSQLTFIEMFGRFEAHRSGRCCKPLGEIAELINGDRSSNYPSGSDIVLSGVLFLSTSNIASDGLDLRNANYITEEKFKTLTRGKLSVRDIVITLRGSLGQTALFENAGNTGFINAQMMIVRAGNKIDPKYLLQFLQLDDMRSHFKRIGSGSAVPQLTAKQISEIQIPVPSCEMQALFVRRVEKIRTLRHKLVRSSQNVDDLFASLQHRAFSGQL